MKTLILDGSFIYDDLPKSFNNKTSIEVIFEKAKKNNFDRFILIQNGKISIIPIGIKNVIISDNNSYNIIQTILKEVKNTKDTVIFNAGSPFYDSDFVDKMYKHHDKQMSDFTYTLGYPEGIIPVIIKNDILNNLLENLKDEIIIKKDYLFYSISKDINSYDIETFMSDIDLRPYRISLGHNDKGEKILTENLFNMLNMLNEKINTDHITSFLNANQEILYSSIYMTRIELTNNSPIKSIYYPDNDQPEIIIDIGILKKTIINLLDENPDMQFIFGGTGEPLAYSYITDLINFIEQKQIQVIIETTGYGMNKVLITHFEKIKKLVIFVLKFDAYDEETYAKIHPDSDFELLKNIYIELKNNDFNVFKQIIRMNENEIEIEKYIRNKDTKELIIRKYSTFCDLLPDKKSVDLSPIKRIPCFLLRRELFINSDLSIPYCFYSKFISKIADFKEDNLLTVKEKFRNAYINNIHAKYENFCVKCNDYYLFNF